MERVFSSDVSTRRKNFLTFVFVLLSAIMLLGFYVRGVTFEEFLIAVLVMAPYGYYMFFEIHRNVKVAKDHIQITTPYARPLTYQYDNIAYVSAELYFPWYVSWIYCLAIVDMTMKIHKISLYSWSRKRTQELVDAIITTSPSIKQK